MCSRFLLPSETRDAASPCVSPLFRGGTVRLRTVPLRVDIEAPLSSTLLPRWSGRLWTTMHLPHDSFPTPVRRSIAQQILSPLTASNTAGPIQRRILPSRFLHRFDPAQQILFLHRLLRGAVQRRRLHQRQRSQSLVYLHPRRLHHIRAPLVSITS